MIANKKGASMGPGGWVIIGITLIFIFSIVLGFFSLDDILPEGRTLSEAMALVANGEGHVSFGVAWSAGGASILPDAPIPSIIKDPNSWRLLDYVFGQIPLYLIEWTNEFSASIIIIGIWFIFLLVFADTIQLFGNFTRSVGWMIAIVLTIIFANLKLLMFISVAVLTITSIFGALSVLASILIIFGMFLAFHFGTSSLREKIIIRRAEGYALRAAAGGDIAASGVGVLGKIAEQAKELAKKKK